MGDDAQLCYDKVAMNNASARKDHITISMAFKGARAKSNTRAKRRGAQASFCPLTESDQVIKDF